MHELLKANNTFWVFPIKAALGNSIRDITLSLHNTDIPQAERERNRKALVHALNAVIDSGFEFYYVIPSKNNNSLSPLVRRTIDSIMSTVRAGIHLVVQRVFKNMPAKDLYLMACYMDSMIIRNDTDTSYLAFPLTPQLRDQFSNVLEKVNASDSLSEYSEDLIKVFSDLVSESAKYYYFQPTDIINLNGFAKKAADLGIEGTVKGIKKVIRHVVKDIAHQDVKLLFKNIHFLVIAADLPYEVCSTEFIEDKTPLKDASTVYESE